MDFERSTLKALFYDYPIESVVEWLPNLHRPEDSGAFVKDLPQLIRWREDSFTTTEAFLMERELEQKWLAMGKPNSLASLPMIYRPFLLLIHIAKQLLVTDPKSDGPLVKFECLFRWKDVSTYLGEDIFTTAYKAYSDIGSLQTSSLFVWPDVLHHDNSALNEVLEKGVSDTHAHHNASTDVFSINWICLTNTLNHKNGKNIKQFQDLILASPQNKQVFSTNSLLVAACFLRVSFFEFLILGKPVSTDDLKDVISILKDESYALQKKRSIQSLIQAYGSSSVKTPSGIHIDYALHNPQSVLSEISNPNLIYQGERNLLYQFFLRFQRQDSSVWAIAPYFYLYILIKTRIRKEIVQINDLKGFENFEKYQDRKGIFVEGCKPYCDIFDKAMFQTTVLNDKDHLESRISPKGLYAVKKNYSRAIFTNEVVRPNPQEQLSFVVHFIKPNYPEKSPGNVTLNNRENVHRFADYRSKSKKGLENVLRVVKHQRKAKDWSRLSRQPRIVGIDAAGQELFCRPEVFAHLFRYARAKGLNKQTYHAGEDFFDLLDGLRSIDEAIFYLQLDGNCRIGHALAAGVNTEDYYKKRNFRVICPRQYLLDNCVWCLMRSSEANIMISNAFETYLNQMIHRLYLECGYGETFDFLSYWNSMLLRGNEPSLTGDVPLRLSDWGRTAIIDDPQVEIAMQDAKAKSI